MGDNDGVSVPDPVRPNLGELPRLLAALTGRRTDRLPVWFMRQAGRSLPEYRRAREGIGMIDACLRPDLVAEITCQPVRRHGVDAAIFFSDIMVPLVAAGVDVEIRAGVGPVIEDVPASADDVRALTTRREADFGQITEAARACVAELGSATPLIAFAGAPFTVAAYVAQGRGTRDHLAARRLMHTDPVAWDALMGWVADLSLAFIRAQVAGGARAAQLFDSWAGSLSRADYLRFCAPYTARILEALRADGVPVIHFGLGVGHMLDAFDRPRPTCIGVDYRTDLSEAIAALRACRDADDRRPLVVQGNIDPALLACPTPLMHAHAQAVVAAGRDADGHIVNLGHGVPPDTPAGAITDLVSYIHSLDPSGDTRGAHEGNPS